MEPSSARKYSFCSSGFSDKNIVWVPNRPARNCGPLFFASAPLGTDSNPTHLEFHQIVWYYLQQCYRGTASAQLSFPFPARIFSIFSRRNFSHHPRRYDTPYLVPGMRRTRAMGAPSRRESLGRQYESRSDKWNGLWRMSLWCSLCGFYSSFSV